MDAKELRLGNWVKGEGVQYQITYLDTHLKGTIIGGRNEGYSFTKPNIDEIKPVPLTEGWLLNFGFISDGEKIPSFNFEIEDGAILSVDINGVWMVGYSYEWGSTTKRIKHVHQLQNLYFALTEKELNEKKTYTSKKT